MYGALLWESLLLTGCGRNPGDDAEPCTEEGTGDTQRFTGRHWGLIVQEANMPPKPVPCVAW